MARQRALTTTRAGWLRLVVVVVATCAISAGVLIAISRTTSRSVASSTTTTSSTSTTTIPPVAEQPGWTVVERSGRGIVVDRRTVWVKGAPFTVARFREGTVAFHWHVGYTDPPGALGVVSADSTDHISWPTEGAIGVVAAFNGGFKKKSHAGGIMNNGVTLEPMRPGLATIGIDINGQLTLGVWGRDLPRAGFDAVTYRQNLSLLVAGGVVATSASDLKAWGSWFGPLPTVPRSGLGVNAAGDVLYVASMSLVTPDQLGQAMVQAGVSVGMQLDINPFWPILGLASHALHNGKQLFTYSLPGSRHSPVVYESEWQRDFFVVLQQPSSRLCQVSFAPTSSSTRAVAHAAHLVGRDCHGH